ncbi:MAG: DUF4824 family protein [Nitrospirota bacterium]
MTPRVKLWVWVAGCALILATNALVLVGVSANRSGEPDAVIELTERELGLPYPGAFARENSGLALRVNWRFVPPHMGEFSQDDVNQSTWLDRAKLVELGFDVAEATYTPERARRYQNMLPRDVLVVMEYDGDAYRQAVDEAQRRLDDATAELAAHPGDPEHVQRQTWASRELAREQEVESRLFVIDAGTDHAQLRAKYPDRSRYLIARGQVRVLVTWGGGSVLRVNGMMQGLAIDSVTVPFEYRHVLDSFSGGPLVFQDISPRYAVTLQVGRRLEPWITGIRGT